MLPVLVKRAAAARCTAGIFRTGFSAFGTSAGGDRRKSAREEIGTKADGRPIVPVLFTPGPLTTSNSTKQAMMIDLGSRDPAFMRVVSEVRESLLAMAGVSRPSHECVLMQGSGTFGVEAVLGSSLPRDGSGKLLVAVNGAYGERMVSMARVLGINVSAVTFHESQPVDVETVMGAVREDPSITHVAVVHHETTAGVLNPVEKLGKALAALPPRSGARATTTSSSGTPGAPGAPPQLGQAQAQARPIRYIVDSMSAFGAYPLDMRSSCVHFLVSSSNKCIEGVPGFSYALCEKGALQECKGQARSLSLDLHGQWAGLSANGQFRFTPPTHALLAFRQALSEHSAEGGPAGRLARYARNHATLVTRMEQLGFKPYVAPEHAGCIITTFLVPDDPAFNFNSAYEALAARGFVIYPGKTTKADSFRMGSIGRLYERDVEELVDALRDVLQAQGVRLPVKQKGD